MFALIFFLFSVGQSSGDLLLTSYVSFGYEIHVP